MKFTTNALLPSAICTRAGLFLHGKRGDSGPALLGDDASFGRWGEEGRFFVPLPSGEGGVFPNGIRHGTGAVELEKPAERPDIDGEGDELEQALGIGAGRHIEGLAGEIDGTLGMHGEGVGGGYEVVGQEGAIANEKIGRGVARGFVRGALVAHDTCHQRRERPEDGRAKEFPLLQAEIALAIESRDFAARSRKVVAPGRRNVQGTW